jgi:hypothetical protein
MSNPEDFRDFLAMDNKQARFMISQSPVLRDRLPKMAQLSAAMKGAPAQ